MGDTRDLKALPHWNGAPADRIDELDIKLMSAAQKLPILCERFKEHYARDPRAGGCSFVARPRVIASIWDELPEIMRDLQKIYVYGTDGSDIVMFWNKVPFLIRHNVVDDNLHLFPNKKIPESKPIDRKLAGDMRIRAARGLYMVNDGGLAS